MNTQVAAWRRALRSPGLQDAGLAGLLLIATWAVGGSGAASDGSLLGAWGPVWWLPTAACVAAVAVRRRWPVPAFAAAMVAAVAQMALGAGAVPADLAVPVTLYTVAAHRSRRVSLPLLGAALAVVVAWSVFVAVDGGGDGWWNTGPFGSGGDTLDPVGAASPGAEGTEAFRPTAWGGILLLAPTVGVAWALGWGARSRRAYLGELEARARDAERESDQQAALAVAAERARLTREMHDVVAHGLAVIVMQAQGGAAAFDRRPADTLAALEAIVATGRASLADMRQALGTSAQLHDAAEPAPGLAELPRLVDRVRRSGTPVRLHVDGEPRPLPAGVDVASYRILQESLTNTMKHAGTGAAAQVLVCFDHDVLVLEISDNGAGGTSVVAGGGGGNGLRGMRERAGLLRGEVTAGPGTDGGYVVRARLPLDPEDPA